MGRGASPEGPSPQSGNDDALIRGIAEGCERSFNRAFDLWAPRLGRFLIRGTRSREEAEDLLQETFIRVIRGAPRYEPRGEVTAWLYRIASNLLTSHWRRQRLAPIPAPNEARLDAAVDRADPEREGIGRAFAAQARAALARLPEDQRLVFILKVDEGLTYEEIAAALDCPVGTAKSRFHHAIRKLKGALIEWNEEPSPRSERHAR
jgi:RNA polymerase sigma-70 factor (ECF subfamily)